MYRVLKFQFRIIQKRFVMTMPIRSEILSVQIQDGVPTMWAKCPDSEMGERFVWHLWENAR